MEEALQSDADVLFGLTSQYAPPGMLLSDAYLRSETIMYINSSVDPQDLANKRHAMIKGGTLPAGVEEANVLYYANREDALNAVELGEADYGYGNAYSIAYYTLRNNYKNIITIPRVMEEREYCLGLPGGNELLLSILNKSIASLDDVKMQMIILDVTSHIERKITLPLVLATYGGEVLGLFLLIIGALSAIIFLKIQTNKELRLQNQRYVLLSQTSNEYMYEYHARSDRLELSETSEKLFGGRWEQGDLLDSLKKALLEKRDKGGVGEISLPVASGEIRTFRVVNSALYDDSGRLHSVIGKLVDISREVAEKKRLIAMSQRDGLTGLYNIKASKELIEERLAQKEPGDLDAFLLMDFDGFKDINDTFGHLAGNAVLKGFRDGLRRTFRKTDIVGRVGGDEFCVYMEKIPSREFVEERCRQLNKKLQLLEQNYPVSISIGIVLHRGEKTYKKLFEKADKALYQAKEKGKGELVFYRSQVPS